jgi:hypothetical protein
MDVVISHVLPCLRHLEVVLRYDASSRSRMVVFASTFHTQSVRLQHARVMMTVVSSFTSEGLPGDNRSLALEVGNHESQDSSLGPWHRSRLVGLTGRLNLVHFPRALVEALVTRNFLNGLRTES